MSRYVVGFAAALYLISSPAFAYIDPGMGSLWIQGAIAFGAGLLITLKMYWQRFKLYLYQIKSKLSPRITLRKEEVISREIER